MTLFIHISRCVMKEQRQDAHRGSAGLHHTWQGIIARARLRSRYMSLFRRLLTVGMRPLDAAAPALASAPTIPLVLPLPSTKESLPSQPSRWSIPARGVLFRKTPMPQGVIDSPILLSSSASAPTTATLHNRSLPAEEGGSSAGSSSSSIPIPRGSGVTDIEGRLGGSGVGGRGIDGRWENTWARGSSAEVRKLAEQISTRSGRRKRYNPEILRNLQVREARGGGGRHEKGLPKKIPTSTILHEFYIGFIYNGIHVFCKG